MAYSGSSYCDRITTPVPGWRLRISLAASMPSFWKFGRHADVGDHHLRLGLVGARDQLVVVGGDADDLDVGLDREQGTHALANEQVVVGQEHRDLIHVTDPALERPAESASGRPHCGVPPPPPPVSRSAPPSVPWDWPPAGRSRRQEGRPCTSRSERDDDLLDPVRGGQGHDQGALRDGGRPLRRAPAGRRSGPAR